MIFSAALARATVATHGEVAFNEMLGVTTCCTFSPELEGSGFEISSHKLDDCTGLKPKLFPDCIEGRTVFPCHLDNSVGLSWGEFCGFAGHASLC